MCDALLFDLITGLPYSFLVQAKQLLLSGSVLYFLTFGEQTQVRMYLIYLYLRTVTMYKWCQVVLLQLNCLSGMRVKLIRDPLPYQVVLLKILPVLGNALLYRCIMLFLFSAAGLFKLPYRVVFAVATLNSLYVYDTESTSPIAILAGLHYAAVTDITW